jgi:hypothetical protein
MQGRRVAMGAALALSVSSLALLGGGTAFAATPKPKPPKGKTTCSTMTGTATGTVTVSGCVDANGAVTGGGTAPLSVATLAAGGTVTWLSGKTSTFGTSTLADNKPTKCPGYVKVKKGQPAVAEPSSFKFSGVVTADNSGMKVPGKFKGVVCISQTGVITAPKALKVS